jgi:hypothetical protein
MRSDQILDLNRQCQSNHCRLIFFRLDIWRFHELITMVLSPHRTVLRTSFDWWAHNRCKSSLLACPWQEIAAERSAGCYLCRISFGFPERTASAIVTKQWCEKPYSRYLYQSSTNLVHTNQLPFRSMPKLTLRWSFFFERSSARQLARDSKLINSSRWTKNELSDSRQRGKRVQRAAST